MFPREPLDSPMASVDGEGDCDGGGDPLPPGVDPAAASGTVPRPAVVSEPPVLVASALSSRVMGESNGSLGDGLW